MKIKSSILVIIFIAVFLAPSAFTQSYGLPKTGQKAVFHPPEPNDLGDDGTLQTGYPLSGRRELALQDMGNGTITDTASGLMWQKKDSFSDEFGNLIGKISWEESFVYVAAMNSDNFADHNDWRVPNMKELLSLANMGVWSPAVYSIFDDFQSAHYWSSSSLNNPYGVHMPYYVPFNEGFVQSKLPTNTAYIKAVRSDYTTPGMRGFPKTGQEKTWHQGGGYDKGDDGVQQAGYPSTADRYTNNDNETITQNATGLIWQQKDSHTQTFGNQTAGFLSWEDAFAYVEEMNDQAFAGNTDWRLPNYFELFSLADLEYFFPSIDQQLFEDTYTGPYWSSTSRYGIPTNALYVSFASGCGDWRSKTNLYSVRAVRAGQYIAPSPSPAHPTPTPIEADLRGIPKTGQITTFHPGDDGDTKIGYPLSGPRYTEGSLTITDNATGLMWQKDESSTHSFGGYVGEMVWEDTFKYVASMNNSNFADCNNWRVPNLKELNSLVDYGAFRPAISSLFTGTKTGTDDSYYGSTTFVDIVNGRHIFQILFDEGYMLWTFEDQDPPPTGFVRAVRTITPEIGNLGFPKTGQTNIYHYPSGSDLGDDGATQAGYPASSSRFQDMKNGTVRDHATGLLWQKQDSAYQQVGEYKGRLEWEDAFDYIQEMNIRHVSGYSTWRMPNIQELQSLIDYSQFGPSLDPIFQNYNLPSQHWSGTSRFLGGFNDYSWAINFMQGQINFYSKIEGFYVKGVLDGAGVDPGPTTSTPTPTPPGFHTPTPIPIPTLIPPLPTPPVDHLYYGLPKTGQINIYHNSDGGNDTGDDGVTRVGYPASVTRWEDTGNGTIIDWGTGLIWQRGESNSQSFGGLSGVMYWNQAFQYVAAMNDAQYSGFNDWRVPNCLELASLRNLGQVSTIPDIFTGTTGDPYWNSTVVPGSSTEAFSLHFDPGQMLPREIASYQGAVRACRSFYRGSDPPGFPRTGKTTALHPADGADLGDDGANQAGYPLSGPRFVNTGNGTVTDNATGLVWEKSCSTEEKTWEEAFSHIKWLNSSILGGKSDWRLPNQMELYSIVDYEKTNPAIDQNYFSDTESSIFWSSNTVEEDHTTAWAVSFGTGFGDHYPKTNLNYVRAVRGDVRPGYRLNRLPVLQSADFSGDGISDIAIFRSSTGLWAVRNLSRYYFGGEGDTPVCGDYNGNGRSDIGIFRGSSGLWAIRDFTRTYFGGTGDLPVPGDYSGNDRADIAIYRESTSLWAVQGVTRAYFGTAGDEAVPDDYSGTGTTQLGVFRSSSGLWAIKQFTRCYFGGEGDTPVNRDYFGGGRAQSGIYRGSTGLWAIKDRTRTYFGGADDLGIPGRYSTGPTNIAIFRPASGMWAIKDVSRVYFGGQEDTPLAR